MCVLLLLIPTGQVYTFQVIQTYQSPALLSSVLIATTAAPWTSLLVGSVLFWGIRQKVLNVNISCLQDIALSKSKSWRKDICGWFLQSQDGKRSSFFLKECGKRQRSWEDWNLGEPGKLGDFAGILGTVLATYNTGKCTSKNVCTKHAYT